MIPATITYFEVSPETVYEEKHGHVIKLAYSFDLDDILRDSDVVKYFDFVEDIVFRLEWKKIISIDESVLIWERELPVYPTKRFVLGQQNRRSAKCFLPRDFLSIEQGFPERADLFCRISLMPLLTSQRRAISYQPHGAYYVLDNVVSGNAADYDAGTQGQDY